MFRYPGGKSRIVKHILSLVEQINEVTEYREPFFGGGSVGLNIQQKIPFRSFWFNDLDSGIYAFWKSVFDKNEELVEKILNYSPSVDDFYTFKNEIVEGKIQNEVDLAFKKLVIHQISYSGLGTRAGGPIGGKEQKGKYDVGCRWNGERIVKKIKKLSGSKNIRITNLSWDQLFADNPEDNVLLYLDPPYYIQGHQMYQCFFDKRDHELLVSQLKETNAKWVLSYDDCSEIREMYDWASILEVPIKYTIDTRSGSKKTKKDLLIFKSTLQSS